MITSMLSKLCPILCDYMVDQTIHHHRCLICAGGMGASVAALAGTTLEWCSLHSISMQASQMALASTTLNWCFYVPPTREIVTQH